MLIRGAALGKYVALLAAVAMLVGYFAWTSGYGRIGSVQNLPGNMQGRIAFLRRDGQQVNLFLTSQDGTDLRQLTDDGTAKMAPSFAPDGRRICYVAVPPEGEGAANTYQVFLVGAGKPRQATYGSISKEDPQWSPKGKYIAFTSGGSIKLVEPNGNNLRQVYPPPTRGNSTATQYGGSDQSESTGVNLPPIERYAWAPSGTAIAAVQVTEGENDNSFGQSRWWDKAAHANHPQTMPDIMEPESVLLLPDLVGGRPVYLRGAAANHAGFAWYADSERLAVSLSTATDNHGIVLYHTDTPTVEPDPIYASGGFAIAPENPTISPDGLHLAFEAWRMESKENRELLGIAVIPLGGPPVLVRTAVEATKLHIVIKGEARKPQWSPDGMHMLYEKTGPTGRDVWVAAADGTAQANLTHGVGDNFDAVWSPVR